MTRKTLLILLLLVVVSCKKETDNKSVIAKIAKDNLTIKSVSVIQVSNCYTVVSNLKESVSSSIEAWNNAPELKQFNRVKSINIVSKNFLKKLNSVNYLNDDKVVGYRFVKKNKSKEFIGYAVVLFHDKNQSTLYYDIHEAPYDYYASDIKKLINKGLIEEINKIEAGYYKRNKFKQ